MNKKRVSALILILSFILVLSLIPIGNCATWLDGWTYRKQINVIETVGAGVGYEVGAFDLRWGAGADVNNSIIFLGGNAQNDFDDVRFTRLDSATLLDYYFVSKTDGLSAIAYVEIQSDLDLGNATIYLYYGNETVSGVSSLANTFVDGVVDDVVLALNFDEGAGGTSIDYSGYGNNGTNLGTTYDPGIFGTSIGNFTQVHNSRITIDDADSLTMGDDGFTWLVWANFTKVAFGGGEEWGTLWAKSDFFWEYWMTLESSMDNHVRLADIDFQNSSDYTVVANTWNYLGLRWNGTSGGWVDYFKNGTRDANSDAWNTGFAGATQTQPLIVGCVVGGGYQFEGRLDELLFVNSSMSNSQISNFYNFYPDMDINEGDCLVRKRYLADDPDWEVHSEETVPVEERDAALRGEIMASVMIGGLIFIPALLLIGAIVLRRR